MSDQSGSVHQFEALEAPLETIEVNIPEFDMEDDVTDSADPGYEIVTDPVSDKEGYCVWYGQCGKGWNNGVLVSPRDCVIQSTFTGFKKYFVFPLLAGLKKYFVLPLLTSPKK